MRHVYYRVVASDSVCVLTLECQFYDSRLHGFFCGERFHLTLYSFFPVMGRAGPWLNF